MTLFQIAQNPFLRLVDPLGHIENFVLARLWNGHDAVAVAHQQVALADSRLADRYGYPLGIDLNAVLARAHGVTAAEHRIAQFEAKVNVTARAVDHRAGEAVLVGEVRHDVAPHGGIFASAVVEYQYRARREIVNEIAHIARVRGIHGAIQHRVGAARHPEGVIARLDPQTLAGNPQLVQRVADGCGLQAGRAVHVAVCHAFIPSKPMIGAACSPRWS